MTAKQDPKPEAAAVPAEARAQAVAKLGEGAVIVPAEPVQLTRAQALAKLREPFPANQVSKLPKQVRKGDQERAKCEDTPRGRTVSMDGEFCGGYHALAVHLDYVGHAALTDRLLEADPEWNWEPMATDPDGLPLFDRSGNLWIRLTVAGMTRLGYGDAPGKSGATKEIIGDALRNAAMRFGAALDLWHKGDLHDAVVEQGTEQNPAPDGSAEAPAARPPAQARSGAQPPASGQSGPDPERQSAWRRRVLSIEYLGVDPKRDGKRDGGLRTAYQDARTDGVLGWPVQPGERQTFAQLMGELAASLPQWPDESADQLPVDETPEQATDRQAQERARAAKDETDPDVPPWATGLGDQDAGWNRPGEYDAGPI